jgi:hypothetical protein
VIVNLIAVAKVAATQPANWPNLPAHVPAQGDMLSWAQNMGPAMAALLVVAGIIYLAFGVYFYRGLVTLNAALAGVYLGGLLGAKFGNSLAGAMVGGCAAAAIVWPGMKYAVAIMGGIFGMLLGASLWRSMNLEPNYAWAGGMMGLIFFGMLSFILFRGSIMMYFSLQGSVMLVFGILGMIYKYQGVAQDVTRHLSVKPFILPLCIFVPTVVGLIYQQTQYPAAPAGGGGGGGGGGKK